MPSAGILYWKRSKYYRPILHNSKSHETSRSLFLEYIKNIGRRKYQRGATSQPQGWMARPRPCGPPGRPSVPIICYMVSFTLEKNQKEAFGTKRHCLEAEPGQNQSRAPTELFCRGNIPPGGGHHRHRHHHRSSHREGVNLHQHLHQHHLLSNPSSSLVFDLGPKTSDWYLLVASSVDYSL
ncbi:hypothetical protein VPH35_080566 [Triticum aestivum]